MKKLIYISILPSLLFIAGCSVPVRFQKVQAAPSHLSTLTRNKANHKNKTVKKITKPSQAFAIRWRCRAKSGNENWKAMGDSLVSAQRRVKHLCEMFSTSDDICRYKGCEQVER